MHVNMYNGSCVVGTSFWLFEAIVLHVLGVCSSTFVLYKSGSFNLLCGGGGGMCIW